MTLIKFKNNGNSEHRPFVPSVFGDLFNNFFYGDEMADERLTSVPAVNISEKPDKYMLELAAPGMKKEDFKIEYKNDVLTISAEKENERMNENERYTRREFSYSAFKRTFNLPDHVSSDLITAQYENGVLLLSIPKKDEAKQKPSREIKVS